MPLVARKHQPRISHALPFPYLYCYILDAIRIRLYIRTQQCLSYGKNFYEQTSFLNKETIVTPSYIHEDVVPYVPKFLYMSASDQ